MSDTKIYLDLSDEIQGALADNGLSIEDILQNESIEANVTKGVLPIQTEGGARTRDVVTIILAGSTAVVAIGFAISKVLKTIYSKPHLVELCENVEIRNEKGEILTEDGKPVFKTVKRVQLLEPERQGQSFNFETNFTLTNGVTMKFGSQDK